MSFLGREGPGGHHNREAGRCQGLDNSMGLLSRGKPSTMLNAQPEPLDGGGACAGGLGSDAYTVYWFLSDLREHSYLCRAITAAATHLPTSLKSLY